jgi:hypothetical protein
MDCALQGQNFSIQRDSKDILIIILERGGYAPPLFLFKITRTIALILGSRSW